VEGGPVELAMLIDEERVWNSVRKLVTRITADWALQQDLTQECVIRLWRLEGEQPGRTSSWYLQNCHFHLRHWLASGRSVDSPKRGNGSNRITIDATDDQPDLECFHTNGEVLEIVSARDIVSTLTRHLTPCESAVLRGLVDGLNLREIALRLNLSYPTALKRRRRIAALTIKLGCCSPTRHGMGSTDSALCIYSNGAELDGRLALRACQKDGTLARHSGRRMVMAISSSAARTKAGVAHSKGQAGPPTKRTTTVGPIRTAATFPAQV